MHTTCSIAALRRKQCAARSFGWRRRQRQALGTACHIAPVHIPNKLSSSHIVVVAPRLAAHRCVGGRLQGSVMQVGGNAEAHGLPRSFPRILVFARRRP